MEPVTSLDQRKLFSRRRYRIRDNGVDVEEKRLLGNQSYRVPFGAIGIEQFEVGRSSRGWFWAALIAFFLSAVMLTDGIVNFGAEAGAFLFYGALGLLFLLLYLGSRESFVGFPVGEGALLFWKDRPSKEQLRNFVDQMHARQREYIQRASPPSHASPSSPVEELERLVALRDRGVLSDDEFERLKQELIGSSPRGFIGFN